jgi:hypothetical protein
MSLISLYMIAEVIGTDRYRVLVFDRKACATNIVGERALTSEAAEVSLKITIVRKGAHAGGVGAGPSR